MDHMEKEGQDILIRKATGCVRAKRIEDDAFSGPVITDFTSNGFTLVNKIAKPI